MEISLSKKQYKSLIKLVYLGEWFVNSYRVEHNMDKEMDDIAHHIYSYAKDFETENLLQKDINKIYPTGKLEEMLEHYIEEYNDDNFWDALIERLAGRDFVDKYDEKEILKMDPFERMSKIEEIEEKYEDEFVENGLKNIIVKVD